MTGKRGFEDQLAALDALQQQPPESTIGPLRKALGHRNNFVVGKAADVIRKLEMTQLSAEVLVAFYRFFENPVKTDPQCWAKNALSRALATFEHQDADVFLRGMKHIQMEPVWGGSSDSAGVLRGTCALALVQCRGLTESALLAHLLELFADKEKFVRVEAARAVEHVGSPAAALLLRLRAMLASDDPEVLGACYGGVLRIEGPASIDWVSRFLAAGDDAAAEAALAIAGTRAPKAFSTLRKRFEGDNDPWFLSALLSAIALTRQDEAMEFLLDLVKREALQAEAAVEAILRSAPATEIVTRLETLVASNSRLARAFHENRRSSR